VSRGYGARRPLMGQHALAYHLPPTTYHLPPTTYHLPPTAYHLPPTTYRQPPTANGLRRARHHQRHDRGCAGGQQGLGGFVQCVAAGHHVIYQGQVLAGHALGVRHAEGAAQVLLTLGAGQAGLAGGGAPAPRVCCWTG